MRTEPDRDAFIQMFKDHHFAFCEGYAQMRWRDLQNAIIERDRIVFIDGAFMFKAEHFVQINRRWNRQEGRSFLFSFTFERSIVHPDIFLTKEFISSFFGFNTPQAEFLG